MTVSSPPPPRPPADLNASQNGDPAAFAQEVLVGHLADRVRSRLAGDGPDHRIIEHRRPSKVLQLGVLPPQPAPDPESGMTVSELAQRLGEPPSSLGLDFLLRTDSEGIAELDVCCAFSVYVQRYPTRDQQRAWHRPDGALDDDDGDGDQPTTGRMRLKGIFERVDVVTDRIHLRLDSTQAAGMARYPLTAEIARALGPILTDRNTVYPFQHSQTMPEDALDSEAAWTRAIHEAEGNSRHVPLAPPTAEVLASWQQDPSGNLRVQVSLSNTTVAPPRGQRRTRTRGERPELRRDLHLFNARLRIYERAGTFAQTRFVQAPEDFRYAPLRSVWVTGTNCVGRRLGESEDPDRPLASETWPCYRQASMVPRSYEGLTLRFADLADETAYLGELGRILALMRKFEGMWRSALAGWPDDTTRQACGAALADFRQDIAGFERGLRCLGEDDQLATAFREANNVFAREGAARRQPITSWRLFQVVYQVIQLAALRARESDDPELLAELDVVDVLWFPTGGGKTEAYLGLITIAMFYDRLRGKRRGVTAILRFPLRMLSVQQLQRLLAVVWVAEERRKELLAAGFPVDGDRFSLGYWIGRSAASPNSLVDTRQRDQREHIAWWADYLATVPREETNKDRIITSCPNPDCPNSQVELEADVEMVRLRHVCRGCRQELPVFVSDDEVYRYLPAVLVCTVDKLAHVARAAEVSSLLSGPLYQCPKHGYFSWHQAVFRPGSPVPERTDRCLAVAMCDLPAADYVTVAPTHDPGPALQVQDELHLIEEELGTFNAHYETLMEEMQRSFGTRRPAKLLAATATIEAYDEQVRQLYARRARVFPSLGWELDRSFYVETTKAARRLFVGVLPYRPDAAEFGEKVQAFLHAEIAWMQDHPQEALGALRTHGLDPQRDVQWLEQELFRHELTLGYVNQKRDADRIQYGLQQLHRLGELPDELRVASLTGDNTLAEIADTLAEIETQTLRTERRSRLRALVATSIVSHGVDLEPLNLMVVNGMTPAVADYIQVSSRAGRSHVGLVIVGYDRRKLRDLSFYRYFLKYHQFLDRLIAPVPVNRFAKFAVIRTVPGLCSALLLHVYGRARHDAHPQTPDPSRPRVRSLAIASELRRWWLGAEPPADKTLDLAERVLRALGIGKRVLVPDSSGATSLEAMFDPGMEAVLRGDANEEVNRQVILMQGQSSGSTSAIFRPEPLTSFRDVDEPLEFSIGAASERIEHELIGAPAGRRRQP
jgi:hypothetical protein